jgi:tetratricopeptide (TPR) repeat protein
VREDNDTRNSFSGRADAVVQAGGIHGGVHIYGSTEPVLPVPRQLPLDVPDFTGRVDELRRLDGFLTTGRTVVIAIVTGAPGVGKTAMVVHWAHRQGERFPDGQLYADLRGFDATPALSARQVLDAFVRALGVAPERIPAQLDDVAALYRSLLASRRILVVLDNAVDVDQVRPLLPGSSTCAVIMTSRRHLAGLVAGSGARRITLDVLPSGEAVTLLGAAVGSDRLDAEPEAAGDLAQLCGHLPLALRIAGERVARSPHWAVSDLADEFTTEHRRLDLLAAVDDEARAVRAAFSWSIRELSAGAASMFRRLGWHPGPEFGVPAAAALAGVPEPEARRTLEVLVDANLLTETGRERYRLHDLMRLYAVERAHTEETTTDETTAVRRLLEWYLQMADAADHLLTRRSYCVPLNHTGAEALPAPFVDQRQAAEWCGRERVNLMAAVHQAADRGEHSIAWRLPVALWGFFFLSKHWSDWTSALTIGLRSARNIEDRRGEAWTLHSLREARFSMHRTGEATEYVHQALAIFRDIGDQWGIREALSNLGYAHRLQGRSDEALVHLREALTLWRQTDDRWGQAWTLHSLGETYLDLSRWHDAAQALREALGLFGDIGHRQAEGFALGNLGRVHLGAGQFASAIDEFQRAMAVHDEVGDRWSASHTMIDLGAALHATGATETAVDHWRKALAVSEDLNDLSTAERIRTLLEQRAHHRGSVRPAD